MFAVLLASVLAVGDYTDPELTTAARAHWSFVPPAKHSPPVVKGPARNPIDRFLLAKLEAAGRGFAPAADRRTLARRLSFDLLGLPPTSAEVDAFLADPSPDAYEKLVERLLASPHFGERQAQHWLDVVRFAESNGYENDGDRPHAWRYRDWVVRAFNADKPFDAFVAEQVAGDLLWKDEFGRMRDEARTAAGAVFGGPLSSFILHPSSSDLLAATGLHRCGPVHVVAGNVDPAENRNEMLTEMANRVGAAVLGLTVGCARCHDHKFDPISLGDYYRLQAFFAGTRFADTSLATPQEKAVHAIRKAFAEARIKPLRKRIEELEEPTRTRRTAERTAALTPQMRAAMAAPAGKQTAEQKKLVADSKPLLNLLWNDVIDAMPAADRADRARLRAEQVRLEEALLPPPLPTTWAVREDEKPPPHSVLKRGSVRAWHRRACCGWPRAA